jgi:hypothetical protein
MGTTQYSSCFAKEWVQYFVERYYCVCKRLRSPGIDSEEWIPPAYVAWRPGTTNRVVVLAPQPGNQFLGSLKVDGNEK